MEGLRLKVWMYHLLPLQAQRNLSVCVQLPDLDLSKLAGPQAVGFTSLIFGHILDAQQICTYVTSLLYCRQAWTVQGRTALSLVCRRALLCRHHGLLFGIFEHLVVRAASHPEIQQSTVRTQKAGKYETFFLFFRESFSHNSVKIQHSLLASEHLLSAGAEGAPDCYYRAFN